MKKQLCFLCFVLVLGWIAYGDPSITVTARQRYPWNGLVDIDCVVSGYEEGDEKMVVLERVDALTESRTQLEHVTLDGILVENGVTRVGNGTWRFVWDAAVDVGTEVVLEKVAIQASLVNEQEEPSSSTVKYCVIDVEEGPDAVRYPIEFLLDEPVGGWTDEYKTTKLVLRKIPAGSFWMGNSHEVTLTEDFWIGVFELTQKQWQLVTGDYFSTFPGEKYPVECISYDEIRGAFSGAMWPSSTAVDEDSFMGRLRKKTGLMVDLPTEAQWEYACRAGTTSAFNSGKNLTGSERCSNMNEVGRYYYNRNDGRGVDSTDEDYSGYGPTHAVVGSYTPNAWGLYDMHGNVWEWCLDWYDEFESISVTNPKGPLSGTTRVYRGGGWEDDASDCISSSRDYWHSDYWEYDLGFRVAMSSDVEMVGISHVDADAVSNLVTIDTRLGTRETHGQEAIRWSSLWAGEENAVARIFINGEIVEEGLVGEGTYLWTPTGFGLYTLRHETLQGGRVVDTQIAEFEVRKELTLAMIEDIPDQNYTGAALEPVVMVSDGRPNRITTDDYSVRYENNVNAGVATVTVTGKRNYTGCVTKRFRIKPVLSVEVHPRYPWNGLVDIDVSVAGFAPDELSRVVLKWVDEKTGGGTALQKVSWNGAMVTNRITAIGNGEYRLVWNAEEELGVDTVQSEIAIEMGLVVNEPLYTVIDLAGGPNATRYPLSFLHEVPVGGWTEEYKSTKLVLRRIQAGTFLMGSPEDEIGRYFSGSAQVELQHPVTLSQDYLIGVFETTKTQWNLVMGKTSQGNSVDIRPVYGITYNQIRGAELGALWPHEARVDSDSFLGVLRRKTGLEVDLPTEAQWEYACRAGTTTALNSGKNLTGEWSCGNLDELGRYAENDSMENGYLVNVGCFYPNAWGLYDMHGNIAEWCLDWLADYDVEEILDPRGSTSGFSRVVRGGGCGNFASDCRSASRLGGLPDEYRYGGFRLAVGTGGSTGIENVFTARSGVVSVDTRTGSRESVGNEQIRWSSEWSGMEGATVRVSVDGEVVVSERAGEGVYEWENHEVGMHDFVHETLYGGEVVDRRTATFMVCGAVLNSMVSEIADRVYTGGRLEPVVTVMDGANELHAGTDYTVAYENNVNVGIATVLVTGIGYYKGTVTKTFRIVEASFGGDEEPGDGTVSAGGLSKFDASTVYDGKPHTIDMNALAQVRVDGIAPSVCYALAPEGPWQSEVLGFVDVCSTSVWYKLSVPNYEDYVHEACVTIRPKMLDAGMIGDIADEVYTGSAIETSVSVTDGKPNILTVNDYTVTYVDNVNAGTARVVVTGQRNYTGVVEKTFRIVRGVYVPEDGAEPGAGTVQDGGASKFDATYVYDGMSHTMNTNALAKVRMDDKKPTLRFALTEHGPWQSEPIGFVNVCSTSMWYKLSVPNYEDYVHEARVTITPKEMTTEMIARIPLMDYTGVAQEPIVVVTDGAPSAITAEDYTVAYADNVNAGMARVVVTGRGNYTGVVEKTFRISTLEEGVDTEGLGRAIMWTTGGDAPWFVQDVVTMDGVDALQSGAIGNSARSWVEATIRGCGTLSFQWRSSCKVRTDYVQLEVDGAQVTRLSGEEAWRTYTMELRVGVEHTVRWTYIKGRSGSAGEDCAWLDQVTWVPMTLEEALDTDGIAWQSSGEGVWFAQTEVSADGVDAAQSGAISHNESSVLSATVVGPGTVSFQWKVSCEEFYDSVEFLLDGVPTYFLSGEVDWETRTVEIPAGSHVLTWEYWKDEMDGEGATGRDCAWVDCVEFHLESPSEPAEPSTGVTEDGVPYVWLEEMFGIPSGSPAIVYEAIAEMDLDGDGLPTWAEYVAGSDPTDPTSVFRAKIEMVGETPVISWEPDLGEARDYRVEGRDSLEASSPWENVDYDRHHFFRVKVAMPSK